jgi:hypothetical protein
VFGARLNQFLAGVVLPRSARAAGSRARVASEGPLIQATMFPCRSFRPLMIPTRSCAAPRPVARAPGSYLLGNAAFATPLAVTGRVR